MRGHTSTLVPWEFYVYLRNFAYGVPLGPGLYLSYWRFSLVSAFVHGVTVRATEVRPYDYPHSIGEAWQWSTIPIDRIY